jgi:hypothetical protein
MEGQIVPFAGVPQIIRPEGRPQIAPAQNQHEQHPLDDISERAGRLAETIFVNKNSFMIYEGTYKGLKDNPLFEKGALSWQCKELLDKVQILSALRQEQKKERKILQKALDICLQSLGRLDNEEIRQAAQIQNNLKKTDDLDTIIMRENTYDLWEPNNCECRILNCLAGILFCPIYCPLLLCCNKSICGQRKIERLKSDVQKGIRS